MSLEAPKNTPEFEGPTERLLLGVRRLRELAGDKSLKASVAAIQAVDAVLGKFPRPIQEFVIDSTAGAVSGLGISITGGARSEARSVLDALMGISATTTKLKRRTE